MNDHEDRHLVLEQYKLYVGSVDRVTRQRGSTNRFYISVLAGLLAGLPVVAKTGLLPASLQGLVFTLVGIVGMLLCVVWHANLVSYRQLNAGKFKVIAELEQRLPTAPYSREWEVLGAGRDTRLYRPATGLELWVPRAFAALYLLMFVYFVTPFLAALSSRLTEVPMLFGVGTLLGTFVGGALGVFAFSLLRTTRARSPESVAATNGKASETLVELKDFR